MDACAKLYNTYSCFCHLPATEQAGRRREQMFFTRHRRMRLLLLLRLLLPNAFSTADANIQPYTTPFLHFFILPNPKIKFKKIQLRIVDFLRNLTTFFLLLLFKV